jgi:nitroimidazol reductase NimA-like FMN-containing flavoprotein (pyridoxamine 5'-phosphate oxidase superfamily)
MIGELNESQIDHLLHRQAVGRIGCADEGQPYIVPVTYVYDGKDIIGQTKEGMKLDIIRKNPTVCFEVDVMSNMNNWQCIILNGTFSELKGKAAIEAREYLFNRVWPLLTDSAIHPHQHEATGRIDDPDRVKPIMYRIKIKERSGRFKIQ